MTRESCFSVPCRSPEEITELCQEMRQSECDKSSQFGALSYEKGVLAALSWLFFEHADNPYDVSSRNGVSLESLRLAIFREEMEQQKENRT